MSSTELILNLTIWILTSAGCFFGLRAWLRRRNQKKQPPDKPKKGR